MDKSFLTEGLDRLFGKQEETSRFKHKLYEEDFIVIYGIKHCAYIVRRQVMLVEDLDTHRIIAAHEVVSKQQATKLFVEEYNEIVLGLGFPLITRTPRAHDPRWW